MYKELKMPISLKINRCLKSAGLKAVTVGLILAAQSLNLPTRKYETKIKKNNQTQYVGCANKILNQMTTLCSVTNPTHPKKKRK